MAKTSEIPDALNEEYYQISADILGSFNKYRPPINIYRFVENVARVAPFYRKGGRLTNEQIEELAQMVNDGLVFVSREDHPVYVKHISYQLDLVLVDKNLKEREIADIFTQALTRRIGEFMEQPVKIVFDKLYSDLMVLTEYIFQDIHRIRALFRRLHTEHSLENHSFNSGVVGLNLFGSIKARDFEEGGVKRKMFDNLTLGLFLHDMGMTKVAKFLRDKTQALTQEERQKVTMHPKSGLDMLNKLEIKFPETLACVMEHHERLNRTGYPQKKGAEELSFEGKLCAVVDSFSAMITKRPYAEAMDQMKASATLTKDPTYDKKIADALQVMLVQLMKL
ncbi:MAG: HD domain-containing protein [Proteobacteria bacterium]|nr:HD domain-containing protein [Pseudomonadota bacterium]MBU1610800.1 HD domain-containing protein [Pseudomonadota bacterium]